MRLKHRLRAVVFVSLAPLVSAQAQSRTDTIQGRVVTDSAVAIIGATINVTRAPDRAFLSAMTDSLGRFRIVFADGTGDYLIHASAPGFAAARQRVELPGTVRTAEVTLKLRSSVQKLATVQVEASRPKPERSIGLSVGTGEAGQITAGVLGIVSPDLDGNLEASALTIAGVSQVPGGISVLGMGPGSNGSTLNGMVFSGSSLPRDAKITTRISTSTYDPSRGGFAGVQTSVELEQGSLYSQRKAHITFDDPSLQYSVTPGAQTRQFRNLQLSTGGDGIMNDDKNPYNYGVQGGTRGSDIVSFENASTSALIDVGLSPSSAARLRSALGSRGFPLDASQISATSQNFSFVGRVDRTPYDWKTFEDAKTSWGLVGFGSVNNESNSGISQLSTSSAGRKFRNINTGVQAIYSSHITPDNLIEVKSTVSVNDRRDIPNSLIPSALVSVSSLDQGSDSSFSTIEVGGPGTTGSTSAQRRVGDERIDRILFQGNAVTLRST